MRAPIGRHIIEALNTYHDIRNIMHPEILEIKWVIQESYNRGLVGNRIQELAFVDTKDAAIILLMNVVGGPVALDLGSS